MALKNTDIIYKNGEIQEINGITFSKGRQVRTIYSGLGDGVKKITNKKEIAKMSQAMAYVCRVVMAYVDSANHRFFKKHKIVC